MKSNSSRRGTAVMRPACWCLGHQRSPSWSRRRACGRAAAARQPRPRPVRGVRRLRRPHRARGSARSGSAPVRFWSVRSARGHLDDVDIRRGRRRDRAGAVLDLLLGIDVLSLDHRIGDLRRTNGPTAPCRRALGRAGPDRGARLTRVTRLRFGAPTVPCVLAAGVGSRRRPRLRPAGHPARPPVQQRDRPAAAFAGGRVGEDGLREALTASSGIIGVPLRRTAFRPVKRGEPNAPTARQQRHDRMGEQEHHDEVEHRRQASVNAKPARRRRRSSTASPRPGTTPCRPTGSCAGRAPRLAARRRAPTGRSCTSSFIRSKNTTNESAVIPMATMKPAMPARLRVNPIWVPRMTSSA